LGTFTTRTFSSPFGYRPFHARGFQFYYRPRHEPERFPARFGFVAFPNDQLETADNRIQCVSCAGQHKNVALALFSMTPERTHACEVFCPLQAADGTETFYDVAGPLRRGRPARGPLFVRDGDCYLVFLHTGPGRMYVVDRSPAATGYVYYRERTVPTICIRYYRGAAKNFAPGTVMAGGLALALGDDSGYGSFDEFRARWSQAKLTREPRGAIVDLRLTGVTPALRISEKTRGASSDPELFVSGKRVGTDTLESDLARQSQRGLPLAVGSFCVDSNGKPVAAYAAPDSSGCVVLQPLPIPVDLTIRSERGTVRLHGLPLGRVELGMMPPRILVEACTAPAKIETAGDFSGCAPVLRCGDV